MSGQWTQYGDCSKKMLAHARHVHALVCPHTSAAQSGSNTSDEQVQHVSATRPAAMTG